MRFRQGGFVDHPDDFMDEQTPQVTKEYYWWKIYLNY
jgi:hypothetical protein